MNIIFHKGLTEAEWRALSLEAQLGNVGSEVARLAKRHEEGDKEQKWHSLDRSLELLDLTIADPHRRPVERWELLRLREVLCDTFVGKQEYCTSPQMLQDYFLPFAMAAAQKMKH